jgi:predicted DNA-binding transcriptional regulator YafY
MTPKRSKGERNMLEIQGKVKRQIEILGLAVDNTERLRDVDLAARFDRDIPTIKRDMQDLRSVGIAVHSRRKAGICLDQPIPSKLLKEVILQYLGICASTHSVDKATSLLVKKYKEKALSRIVTLQRCIESKSIARITYEKDAEEIERDREICPVLLFNSEGSWRVLAMNEGKTKQFHIIKMLDVAATDRKFKPPTQEQIDALFEHSFRSWIGTENHVVRLSLNATWAERVKPQQMMESQVITEGKDGSIVLETTVNSLDEVASWVVSRGAGVTVLEPPALKEKVLALARGALANYGK